MPIWGRIERITIKLFKFQNEEVFDGKRNWNEIQFQFFKLFQKLHSDPQRFESGISVDCLILSFAVNLYEINYMEYKFRLNP